MSLLLALVLAPSLVGRESADYKVLQVKSESVFAGRLGDRVREDLIVEGASGRVTIHVRGDYHTQMTRPSQRFHAGDQIRLAKSVSGPVANVDRWSITIVRP